MNVRLLVACAAAVGLIACSGNSSSSSSSGSTSGTSTTTGGTTGSTTGGTTTGGSTTGGTTGGASVNGCSAASATDLTGQATAHIAIAGFAYSPACIKVSTGTQVTIDASGTHPLSGGTNCTADTSSPIPQGTSAKTVTFSTAGSFGFFCQNHCQSNGMQGAVFVQ